MYNYVLSNFFLPSEPFSFSSTLAFLLTCCEVGEGRGKGGLAFEKPTIYKWLPLVWYIHLWVFVFRSLVPGSMSWRKELCHHSLILCTQPSHSEYYLLSLLAFLMLLLFLGFIIHVSDFRCMWSQVLEIWDNFKITDAKSWLFEPTSATGLGD